MFRRKITRAVAVTGMALVLIGSVATSALASPASFSVSHHHAAGRGALAVKVYGGLTWHNRSVTLNDAWVWVKANECGLLEATGYGQRDGDAELEALDTEWSFIFCPPSNQDLLFFADDIVLDASQFYGGITRVDISAVDDGHLGLTTRSFFR
jgi:hypothetical protein